MRLEGLAEHVSQALTSRGCVMDVGELVSVLRDLLLFHDDGRFMSSSIV